MAKYQGIVYACANMKQLDRQYEWPLLIEPLLLRVRMNHHLCARIFLQCLVSFTIADLDG